MRKLRLREFGWLAQGHRGSGRAGSALRSTGCQGPCSWPACFPPPHRAAGEMDPSRRKREAWCSLHRREASRPSSAPLPPNRATSLCPSPCWVLGPFSSSLMVRIPAAVRAFDQDSLFQLPRTAAGFTPILLHPTDIQSLGPSWRPPALTFPCPTELLTAAATGVTSPFCSFTLTSMEKVAAH